MPIEDAKKTGVVLKCGKGMYSSVMTTCTTSHKKIYNRAPTWEELIADMYTQWRNDDNNSGGKNDIEHSLVSTKRVARKMISVRVTSVEKQDTLQETVLRKEVLMWM